MRGKGMFTRLGEAVYAAILAADPPAAGVVGVLIGDRVRYSSGTAYLDELDD